MSNPFASTPSQPGSGIIHLALLPPATPRLRTVKYQYPLKLVTPAPVRTATESSDLIHTIYLLTYGGGLVAGDGIDLHVILEPSTRLVLLTQGSTKLFKSPSRDVVSKQSMVVDLAPESAFCYLPDPVQPFEKSSFEQQQIYNIQVAEGAGQTNASLCVLDWVSNGRPANGENWSFYRYGSRNEIYLCSGIEQRKLLLRDNLFLDDGSIAGQPVAHRMDNLAIYGTLVLQGSLFRALGEFFMDEFKLLPRIGNRNWDTTAEDDENEPDQAALKRVERHQLEIANRLQWSAASIRGCVVVKFGAPELESARRWLWAMLVEEGSLVTSFGERALLCLR